MIVQSIIDRVTNTALIEGYYSPLMSKRILSTEHLIDDLQNVYDIINKKSKHPNRRISAHIDGQPGVPYINKLHINNQPLKAPRPKGEVI
jgi:hypothetical protein